MLDKKDERIKYLELHYDKHRMYNVLETINCPICLEYKAGQYIVNQTAKSTEIDKMKRNEMIKTVEDMIYVNDIHPEVKRTGRQFLQAIMEHKRD